MKFILIAAAVFLLNSPQCNRQRAAQECFRGRLEIKGICMNYTISITGGRPDTSLVQAMWTDEHSGKSYQNVFGLDSPCNFPDMPQGREFYFVIDPSPDRECAVCLAYYPTPEKKLSIKVIDGPCEQQSVN